MSAAGVPSVHLTLEKNGKTVARLLHKAEDQPGGKLLIKELVVVGDLTGTLDYGTKRVEIEAVEEIIGLLVDESGARGPVWRGVHLRAVSRQ